MKPTIPDGEFMELYRTIGPSEISRRTKITLRNIHARRASLERKYGISIVVPDPKKARSIRPKQYPQRAVYDVQNGTVFVGSDFHLWPGSTSLMFHAFVTLCKEYKPKVVVLNGDVIDAPQISRHPPIGWESRPSLKDEIENAKERVHEIEKASGKAEKVWNLGNHDARYETRLATVAPEYAKIHGVHLSDHFPLWRCAWSTWINDDLVIKHRFKGGIHAPHNNTIWAGKSIVTGHLHSAKVIPFTDYNGTRWGIDTGCVAEPDHKAFIDYTEDNPKNWLSAFGIFTFKDGKLMYPELVTKWDDETVQFRGEVFKP